MRLLLVVCLLALCLSSSTARPGKGKGGSKGLGEGGKMDSRKGSHSGEIDISSEVSKDVSKGGRKGGSKGSRKGSGKGSHSDEINLSPEIDDVEIRVQWEGLTSDQIALFESNGVTVTSQGGVPHYRFEHPGAPTDSDITNQFPGFGNPNAIRPQNYNYEIPIKPSPRSEPGCLPMGPIGMTVEGYTFYNPYTLDQEDAVEVEVMGKCNGHPSPNGGYHHHAVNNCTFDGTPDQLLGVAFDGIPILGAVDADGNVLKSADLDMCHGRVDEVDGVPRYRYRITSDFPYILGCYRGNPRNVDLDGPNCSIPTGANPFVEKLIRLATRIEDTLDDESREEKREKKTSRPGRRGRKMKSFHKALKTLLQRRFMGGL